MKKIALFLAFLMLFTTGVDAQRKRRSSRRTTTSRTTTASQQLPEPISLYGYAAKWKEKAESGDAEAQNELGVCFDNGLGTSKNYTEALKWFRKAAEQDYPLGVWNLALMYEYGKGVTKNTTTAKSLYNKAHKLALPLANNGNASAQVVMALLYKFGDGGLAQNKEEAVKWYRKAAEQGYAHAQNELGFAYEKGEGVAQNYDEAVKWWRKAAEQGFPNSQNALGFAYKNGEGVAQNYEEAVKWYRKAAEQGFPTAQYNLAVFYEKGLGVAQNMEEAVKWYRKAAEQGYARAQANLAACYQKGKGVAQNKSTAIKWYRKAAEQGDEIAQDNLNYLLSENKRKRNSRTTTSQRSVSTNYDKFYGTWTSAHGSTFTIERGPYLNLVGAGRWSGEWRSNGELHVSFGYPDEVNLRYSNGYLYDRDGRMYWRVP